jgi:hypothetical protein
MTHEYEFPYLSISQKGRIGRKGDDPWNVRERTAYA